MAPLPSVDFVISFQMHPLWRILHQFAAGRFVFPDAILEVSSIICKALVELVAKGSDLSLCNKLRVGKTVRTS